MSTESYETPSPALEVSVTDKEIIIEEVPFPQDLDTQEGSMTHNRIKPGAPKTIWMSFALDGMGSFTCGGYNTANGAKGGWFKFGFEWSHRKQQLKARPAPGHKFSHWLFNGNYSSSSPTHFTYPLKGLCITAVFKESD